MPDISTISAPANLAANSHVVGDDIRRVERSIQTAMSDTAKLVSSVIETIQADDVCARACQAALLPIAETFDGLLRSHGIAARKAHPTLEKIGATLGLDETSWGGGAPKHPDAVFFPRAEDTSATVD